MDDASRETPLSTSARIFLCGLGALSALTICLSALYLAFRLDPLPSLLLLAGGVGWFLARTKKILQERTGDRNPVEEDAWWLLPAGVAVLADLLLLGLFFRARTDLGIVTPWDVAPVFALPLYGLSTFLLTLSLPRLRMRIALPLLLPHLLLAFGLALIVFAFGFGFDPFIHQVTESHILRHGEILPKQPFYIGQYVLVVITAMVTRFSVENVDRFLVPVIGFATIIPALHIGLTSGWKTSETKHLSPGIFALLISPLAVLTFTIPHHLSVVFGLLAILLLPTLRERRLPLLILLCLASLVSHPLFGIPVSLLCLCVIASRRSPQMRWLPAFAIPICLFAAFLLQSILQKTGLQIPDAEAVRASMHSLFAAPYPTGLPFSWLKAFHQASRLIPPLLIATGAYGFFSSKNTPRIERDACIGAAAGTFLAAVLLGIFIRLPGILPEEQFEYALRLLYLLPLFFLPGLGMALEAWLSPTETIGGKTLVRHAAFASLAVASWTLLYPQNDGVIHLTSPGLSRNDLAAFARIDEQAKDRSYAGLAPPFVSIAALKRHGFERTIQTPEGNAFFFPLPTGASLYGRYLDLLSSTEPTQELEKLFAFTHQDLIFVALPAAWDPDGTIGMRLASLATWSRTEGEIQIYEFTKERK